MGGWKDERIRETAKPFPKRIEVTGTGRDVANARLIAAAPELHAQCKLFERAIVELMVQGETGGYEELEKLRAILAKVDGGAG